MATAIIVMIIILVNIYNGIRNGAILELVRVSSAFVGIVLAERYYQALAEQLSLLIPYPGFKLGTTYAYFPAAMLQNMDIVFFRLTAIILIVILTWVGAQVIYYLLRGFKLYPLPAGLNRLVGMFSGIFVSWYGLFFAFAFLSVLALEPVQTYLDQSAIADFFVLKTPYLSEKIYSLIIEGIGTL